MTDKHCPICGGDLSIERPVPRTLRARIAAELGPMLECVGCGLFWENPDANLSGQDRVEESNRIMVEHIFRHDCEELHRAGAPIRNVERILSDILSLESAGDVSGDIINMVRLFLVHRGDWAAVDRELSRREGIHRA